MSSTLFEDKLFIHYSYDRFKLIELPSLEIIWDRKNHIFFSSFPDLIYYGSFNNNPN